jgi:hypothetical protein
MSAAALPPTIDRTALNRKGTAHSIVTGLIIVALLLGVYEVVRQALDVRYVKAIARDVLRDVPSDNRSRVIALRDYIRKHVKFEGAPYDHRPFLRATAAETLKSGRGYCGEVSRAFICMAGTVGIRAQRINLYGKLQHVVAEAEIAPSKLVVVDAQNPPYVRDLESLDDVIRMPQFDDYYTLNLRRLHVEWLVTRLKLRIGVLTYWTENPAALKALFFFSFAALLLFMRALRLSARRYVRSRGWIHMSEISLHRVQERPEAG